MQEKPKAKSTQSASGITLIALVISVIVLLILAAVSMSLITGDSEIFSRAQASADKYDKESSKEALQLALMDVAIRVYSKEVPAGTTISEFFKNTLEAKGWTVGNETANGERQVTVGKYVYNVDTKTYKVISLVGEEENAGGGQGGTANPSNPSNPSNPVDNPPTVTTYTVTYSPGGGTGETMETTTGEAGNTVTLRENSYTRVGYTFLGWNTNASATTATYEDKANVTLNGNLNLYAIWEEDSNIATISKDIPSNHESDFVGCYADIDRDGDIDGIIFVDLLVQAGDTVEWENESYKITAGVTASNVKEYVKSEEEVTDARFDSKARYKITPVSDSQTEKKDRFYVMGLDNITCTIKENGSDVTYDELYWYYNAYDDELMTDYKTVTSKAFGAGITNTEAIIAKRSLTSPGTLENPWYGEVNSRDLWGCIPNGWFVPSLGEWATFCEAFNWTSESVLDYPWDDCTFWTSSAARNV